MDIHEQGGESVDEVVRAAFGREVVVQLARELRSGDAHIVSLVAADAGRVVGHVQLSRSWVDAASRLVAVAVLSPLSVLPAARRRGIGSALVRAAVSWAGAAGWPVVFLEGDPGYYGRLGFTAAGDDGFSPPSVRIPLAAFQATLLPAYEPWMRGALVYADVFWRLDCVGLR